MKSVKPNDPDFDEKINKEIEKLRNSADNLLNQSDTTIVAGGDISEKVKENIRALLNQNSLDTILTREYFYLNPVLVINVEDNYNRPYLDSLSNFSNLKALYIRGNRKPFNIDIDHIVMQLEGTEIEDLFITNCADGITVLPESISRLKSIKNLGLFGNKLKEIPKSIGDLENLETLYLDSNPITDLPYTIKNLLNLSILGIASTNISPADINRLQTKYPLIKILTK